jgi:tetratricopeptide (TPR) repeat protein
MRKCCYDDAWALYDDRLRTPLYYNFGEYELNLQLLVAIPQAEDGLPRLKSTTAQAWSSIYAAMCFERTGQLVTGSETLEPVIQATRARGARSDLMAALLVHSMLSCDLGRLSAASGAAREAAGISDEIGEPNWIGISHRSYGRVLMTCGAFDRAQEQFEVARSAYGLSGTFAHGRSVLLSYEAILSMWQGRPNEAFERASEAGDLAQSASLVREGVAAKWLKGAAMLARAQANSTQAQGLLSSAADCLSDALTECRRINLLEFEPELLLTWAKWHRAHGDAPIASQYAEQALILSRRSGYRLKEADILNCCGELALDAGHVATGRRLVEQARDLAFCDGHPYVYQMAFDSSRRLLDSRP